MRNLTSCKNTVIGLVILVVLVSTVSMGTIPLHAGNAPYVLVTLRDNSTLKFQYDTFSLHWFQPQIKNEITCEVTDFNPVDVVEIWVLSRALNECDFRDDEWLFDLTLNDKGPIQGFIEVTEESITGKLVDTGEEKTILFPEVKKITYYHQVQE